MISTGTKRMRLLLVAARYYPYTGGTETHVHEVARRLSQAGIDVTILTTDPSGTLPSHEQIHDVQIRRVRAFPPHTDYHFAPAIYRIITQGDWDIVHCQGYHTLVAPLAMIAALRAGKPYIVSFHSGGHSSRIRNLFRGVQRALLRPLLARAKRLVAVSQFEAAFFQKQLDLPSDRFVVIPNGAQLPHTVLASAQDNDGTLILSIGRLERYKGHHRVLAAMPELLRRQPTLRLRIVGSGPYEPQLQKLACDLSVDEHVEIGPIPPSDRQGMATLLVKAALVTLLSDYEAHPITVMEALAMGRPMLVADNSGFKEIAERGLVRAISVKSSSQQISEAILELLCQPRAATNVVLPTWEECTTALLQLYESVHEVAVC